MEEDHYYRSRNRTRTIFNYSVILAILLIGFSIFYYLVIFLPRQEQQKIERQRVEQESERRRLLNNKVNLNSCLQDVNDRQQKTLQDPNSKKFNREDLKILLDQFNKQKDECYKRYPQ